VNTHIVCVLSVHHSPSIPSI